MEKKAVLVVSFGTSYQDTREKTLDVIEDEIREAFPEYEFRKAYTSPTIRRILKDRDGIEIDDVEQALARLAREDYHTVIVQPTHVIHGFEYDRMMKAIEGQRKDFAQLVCGEPLLTEEEDYRQSARILGEMYDGYRQDGTDIILMGHGTEHAANEAYRRLQQAFFDENLSDFLVGTVEASPTLENMMSLAGDRKAHRVVLVPYLVVAGEHVIHDMAGDQEGSWKSRFERSGYQVECVMRGLGEYPGIRGMYLHHARQAGACLLEETTGR